MGARFRYTCVALVALSLACAVKAQAFSVVSGGTKFEVDGRLELQEVERVETGSPAERPQGRLRLQLGAAPSSTLRFWSDLTATAGGTPRHARGAGVFDLDHVKQDLSPSLEANEAYFELSVPAIDVRVGLQRFAWGKLDGEQPNDLLNPQEFFEPLLEEEEDRKVGVPALAPTVYLPSASWLPQDLRVTAVWAPIVVPYHFPDQDERWYPPLARVPPETVVMGFRVRNQSRFVNRRLPARTLGNGTWAGRVQGYLAGVNFALYAFDGYDNAPSLGASARAFVRANLFSPQLFDVRSEIEVFPVFDRIRSAGADLAANVLGVTFRAEGAYISDRLYPRTVRDVVASQQLGAIDLARLVTGQEQEVPVKLSPVNVRRDGVEWGVGGDTIFADGTFLLLQASQTIVLHNHVDLLISDFEARFAMTVRKNFLDDRLRAELIGLYGMQGVYGLAHPRVTYAINDYLDVRVGYLLIEGHERSFLGQFKRNDEVYVRTRLLF